MTFKAIGGLLVSFLSYDFKSSLEFDSKILLPTKTVELRREMQVRMIPSCRYIINMGKLPIVCPSSKGKMSAPNTLENFYYYELLHVRDPSLSMSHYNSTIVILLPNRDVNSWANPEPQLKVQR